MPIHISKSKSDEVLVSVLETGYPCVGVMVKAFQTGSCDQGEEISRNNGMSQGQPHGSFSLALEAALAEIDRLMNDEEAVPADHGTNAAFIQAQEGEEIRFGIIGLHSTTTSDLRSVTEQFFTNHGASESDADDLRLSATDCQ